MRKIFVLLFISLLGIAFNFAFSPANIASANVNEAFPTIDYSYAGYEGSGASLPLIPATLFVRPTGGDDTALLQAALDELSKFPTRPNGFRGALLLEPGRFRVSGQLRLRESGIVLRGSRDKSRPTIIVATGLSRRTLIEIGNDEKPVAGEKTNVTDEIIPAGSLQFAIENINELKIGDRVAVTRPSTAEWIAALGMNKAEGAFADQRIHWLPGSRDLVWQRKIAAIEQERKRITLDAPLTMALNKRFGGGSVAKIRSNELASKIGLENLILESEFDQSNPKDEEHAWIGVGLNNVEDAWVRDVTARHFAGSAIRAGQSARRVTIENCRSEAPVSEIGGYRRQSFLVEGQQVLVRNCESEAGINDFAVGFGAAGPNVFLDCTAKKALGASGAFESLASGILYENVHIENADLRLTHDMTRAQGGGWTAVNSVVWNSVAREIKASTPEGAENIVRNSPESLLQTQLKKRLGDIKATTETINSNDKRASEFRLKKNASAKIVVPIHPVRIINGRFTVDNHVLWGGMLNAAWWKGQVSPFIAAKSSGVSITRFVPGRNGLGLTENLLELATHMKIAKMPFYNSGPGLWYDRRRDAHTITPQPDAEVWAPFYEMPWMRSGQGTAFDGLSKYDLTRFNPWYFDRTQEFARLSEQNGLLFYHNLYNTHNLLETAAHWVDFPWRAVNNINDTGLEPQFEARNTVHVANQFYDPNNPKLRALHLAFIRHNLDVLNGSPNVVFILAFQFAGPLEFQQFFLDTVADWEKQKKRKVKIALVTSKDITDAILNDPVRSKQVSVIDMRYWQYRPDGTLWAPKGGQNLAFREIITKDFGRSGDSPPPTTPEQVYRQVREYRDRFPDRAIVAWNSGAGQIPILMAGGAQALMRNPNAGQSQGAQPDNTAFDDFVRENLGDVLMHLVPKDNYLNDAERNWCLAAPEDRTIVFYSPAGANISLAKTLAQREYQGVWFNEQTGKTEQLKTPTSWNQNERIEKPSNENWLLLLKDRH